MRFWIEVTSGIRFERLQREGVQLDAPSTTRYQNFFRELRKGDMVLHYTTGSLSKKEWGSKIIAISIVEMDPKRIGNKIVALCGRTRMLPEPVPLGMMRGMENKSERLSALIHYSMQRYLTEIEQDDLIMILKSNEANEDIVSWVLKTL
jgi:hypothetical protein